jgi:16S rRNA (guanine1516-N2)-methyltransferase
VSDQAKLERVDGRLVLRDLDQPLIKPIFVDFMSNDFRRRAREPRKVQLLAKALGLTNRKGSAPVVVDATAGLGTDAALMAQWGCRVTAIERSSLIFQLLEDGHVRAVAEGFEALSRMTVVHSDAETYLRAVLDKPDIIFIDPMYPDSKKTALPRKEMQILRGVLEPSAITDVMKLLDVSLTVAVERVVIKRPPHADTLKPLGRLPSHTLEGKAVRYDIYLVRPELNP